jgi:aquaporin Z
MTRKLTAEALGTAILVFFGCGAATLMFGFGLAGGNFASGVIVTALTFGLVLMGLAYALGPISAAHVNPAVTVGALVAGRIGVRDAVLYLAAQVVGAFAGAGLLLAMFNGSPTYSRTLTGLGADGYGSASHIGINASGAFLAEVVLTAVFVFVILAVTAKGAHAATAALAIGLTLTLVHLVGIPIDGTSVNPARALAPAVLVGGMALKQVWLFVVAPLVGGAVAALVFRYFESAPESLASESIPAATKSGRATA